MEDLVEKKKAKMGQKVKGFLLKALFWLKDNWVAALLFLVIGFVVVFAARGCSNNESYQTLFNQYKDSIEDNKKQLEELDRLQQQERTEREAQMQHFLEEMQRIEAEYKEELQRVEQSRNQNRTKIVEDARRDPRTLTTRIRDTFGIPIDE